MSDWYHGTKRNVLYNLEGMHCSKNIRGQPLFCGEFAV